MERHNEYIWYDEFEDAVDNLITNKSMRIDSSNITLKGESNSQYIPFLINRFYDGVDLTKKAIRIHYVNANGAGDYCEPVNVEYDENQLRFGWLVPAGACVVQGDLKVAIEIFGSTSRSEDYVWKSQIYIMSVDKALDVGQGIVEPGDNWFTEFERQCNILNQRIAAATEKDPEYGAEIRDARIDDQGTDHPTVNERFISDLKRMYAKKNYEVIESNKGTIMKVWVGTEDQYNQLVADGEKEDEVIYHIQCKDDYLGNVKASELLESNTDGSYKAIVQKAKCDADGNDISKTYMLSGSMALYPYQEKEFQLPLKAIGGGNLLGGVFDLSSNTTYLIIAINSCALCDYYGNKVITYLKPGVNFLTVKKSGGDDGNATYILNNESASITVDDSLWLCSTDINGIQTYKIRYK